MGLINSTPIGVRVTDQKTLILKSITSRLPYSEPKLMEAQYEELPWLKTEILEHLVPFLYGSSLVRCFETSPLWYSSFFAAMNDVCAGLDAKFQEFYSEGFQLIYSRTDWAPVHVTGSGKIRIDRVLIAKVLPSFVNKSLLLSYKYKHARGSDGSVGDDSPQDSVYTCGYKCDIYRRGARRRMWVHKDICRFHGDETRVAATQNVTPVCVEDRVEIAINLYSPNGLVDVKGIRFLPLVVDKIKQRPCPIEAELHDWYDYDTFQAQSVERLQIPDFFAPNLVHLSTEFAGIDVAVSRSEMRAEKSGHVPQTEKILGTRVEIYPRDHPAIIPLKRVGLQHDRFTRLQLRVGDNVVMYISQGGKST